MTQLVIYSSSLIRTVPKGSEHAQMASLKVWGSRAPQESPDQVEDGGCRDCMEIAWRDASIWGTAHEKQPA